MNREKNIIYQLKLIFIVFFALLFLTGCWVGIYKGLEKYRENIINNWLELQKNQVNRICDSFINDENYSLEDYSKGSYGFIYENQRVILEKNQDLTKLYKGESIREVYGDYSYNGGQHLSEVLEKMENGESGEDYFIKDYSKGEEIVSWNCFKKDNREYIIGMASSKGYILEKYSYNETKNIISIAGVIYSGFLVLFSILLCFNVYRSDLNYEMYTRENQKKQEAIKKLGTEIDMIESKLKSLVTYDMITQLYNRKFFNTFIEKIDNEVILPVSIILFNIVNVLEINEKYGYEKGDEIFNDIAEIIKGNIGEYDIAARYAGNCVAIVLTRKDKNTANIIARNIITTIHNKYNEEIGIEIKYGIITKEETGSNIKKDVSKIYRDIMEYK